MDFLPEIIIAAIILAGIIIYILSAPKFNKRKLRLLAKYRRTRNKSLSFQDKLSAYILENDAKDELIAPNITYGDFLKQLRKQHSANLSEKRYKRLRKSIFIVGITDRELQKQERRLQEAEKKITRLNRNKKSPVYTELTMNKNPDINLI